MRYRLLFHSGLRLAFFVGALTALPLAVLAQDRPSRESYLFKQSDANGDGWLDAREFSRIHAASGRGGQPSEAFAEADANGDGRLELHELIAWYRSSG